MSTPSTITVSLEWAKKLKEAGWPQSEPLHYWHRNVGQWYVYAKDFSEHDFNMVDGANFPADVAAPTAEEILRRLPYEIMDEGEAFELVIAPRRHGGWNVFYTHENGENRCAALEKEDSLANAAAAMWVYLKEHDLLPSDK